jgi:NAD(P)-dependent dehydrogenase (short-subunit alcohol dehydrogenase family)
MGFVDGKAVIVLGATSGIGAATAELLIHEGADVVLGGRRAPEGDALARCLGSHASFVSCDVRDESEVEALAAAVQARHERIDALVNCAGDAGAPGGVAGLARAGLERTLAVHLGGALTAMKHVAPVMIEQGSGSIVNVASIGARIAGWTGVAYAAAKAGVVQATRSAAVELGEHGVRANSVSPGPILTGIFGKGAGLDPADADGRARELEPLFTSVLAGWQPLRRAGVPGDVAPACAWLVSDASGFVNGLDLIVDGGISAGRPASVSLSERKRIAEVLLASGTLAGERESATSLPVGATGSAVRRSDSA